MLAPGVPALMSDFHSSSTTLSALVVSVYVLGYVFGPIILAPLSELYGRLPLYHASNVGFVIFTIACALATDLDMLIAFRFVEGVFGSCPLTIGGGSIGDLVVQEKRGGVMAIWALGPLMGPVIGPVAGGYVSDGLGWRWVFWIIAIVVCLPFPFPCLLHQFNLLNHIRPVIREAELTIVMIIRPPSFPCSPSSSSPNPPPSPSSNAKPVVSANQPPTQHTTPNSLPSTPRPSSSKSLSSGQ